MDCFCYCISMCIRCREDIPEMKKSNTIQSLVFILPTVFVFAMFFIFPVGILGVKSFSGSDGFTFDNYIAIITNARYSRALFNSLWLSLTVTLAALVIAGVVAFFLARNDFKGKNFYLYLSRFRVATNAFFSFIGRFRRFVELQRFPR